MANSPRLTSLKDALDAFKRQSVESTRFFLAQKIRVLGADDSLSDKQRLDKLAPYLGLDKWSRRGYGGSITTPSAILRMPSDLGYVNWGIDGGGFSPSLEAKIREPYLEALSQLVNEVYTASLRKPMPDLPSEPRIDLPTEFTLFLSLYNSASDPDIRQSGTCGIMGLPSHHQPVRAEMSDLLPEYQSWKQQGWDVLTGWGCAVGEHGASTAILYARNAASTQAKDRIWSWRIAHVEPGSETSRWFDSIVDFLAFHVDWAARLPPGWESHFLLPTGNGSSGEDHDSNGEDHDSNGEDHDGNTEAGDLDD